MIIAVVLAIVIGATLLFFNQRPNITGAIPSEPVDLKTFDYSSVGAREDFPKVNITGVIDNACLLPSVPLWSRVGAGKAGGSISIEVRGCPGTEMQVIEIEDYEGTTWYHVQKYEKRGDLQMWWDGWTTGKVILQGPLPVPVEES